MVVDSVVALEVGVLEGPEDSVVTVVMGAPIVVQEVHPDSEEAVDFTVGVITQVVTPLDLEVFPLHHLTCRDKSTTKAGHIFEKADII